MTCHEYHSRLSSYMDGELSRWRRWKIENHLRRCNECATVLRELEDTDRALAASLLCDPSPGYMTDAVMLRIPAMPPARRRPGGMLPWAAGLAVAGMQAMVLLGAYWSGFAHGSSTAGLIGGNIPGQSAPRNTSGAASRNTTINSEPQGFTSMPFSHKRDTTALTDPVNAETSVRHISTDGRAAKPQIVPTFKQLQGAH